MRRTKKEIKAEEKRLGLKVGECGTDGWKDYIVPDKPLLFPFKWACRSHDIDYHIGGIESDRVKADQDFLYALKAACRERYKWPFKAWRRAGYAIAWTYFYFVRKHGHNYFNFTKS